MDFSKQDPHQELNASDFQDELDSTVLVRESPWLKTGPILQQESRKGDSRNSPHHHDLAGIFGRSKDSFQERRGRGYKGAER